MYLLNLLSSLFGALCVWFGPSATYIVQLFALNRAWSFCGFILLAHIAVFHHFFLSIFGGCLEHTSAGDDFICVYYFSVCNEVLLVLK